MTLTESNKDTNRRDRFPRRFVFTPMGVLCKPGQHDVMVMAYLQSLGYTNVRNLNGSMNGWIAAELPVVK